MIKRVFSALLLSFALISCGNEPVIKITTGQIQGVASATKGVTVFKGIPYAAAPVGDLRWRLPQDAPAWEGVKVADTFGNIAYQADLSQMDLYGKEFYSAGMPEMSEDCLYLNVWAPSKTLADVNAKLPVAVWIHGGAFDHGWGYEDAMDGEAWAKRGVILVTINYRVGIFGFFAHPELTASEDGISGNYGLYDQLKALEWVNSNIAQFGGDPENITIMGQSAGARSVQFLCSSKMAQPYIAKAIIQSGGGISPTAQHPMHLDQMAKQGEDFAKFASCDSIAALRALSYSELMDKVADYKEAGNAMSFRPVLDFMLASISFSSAAAINEVKDIPYMIGSVEGDGKTVLNDIDQFCASRDYYSGQPVYEYEFTRALPGDSAGAFHSSELWYTFGTLDRCWRPFTAADHALSEKMLDAWTNFAKYGDPNGRAAVSEWPAFTQKNSYRKIFDVD